MSTTSRIGIPGRAGVRASSTQRQGNDVRIGPISIFALIVVLCMAVLAVLSISTAQASYAMAGRQATSISEQYLDETAAQTLIAAMDEQLVEVREGRSAEAPRQLVDAALPELCAAAQEATSGQVEVHASITGSELSADFTCENGRILYVVATVLDDGTYRIDKWKLTAVATEEEPGGTLWTMGQ